jgi:hypothetical protein
MAVDEAHRAGLPAPARPAIGGGGRQPRKVLRWQAAIALLLIIVLLGLKYFVASRAVGVNPLAALPGGNQVAAGLDIGGIPTDDQLEGLAGSYGVDGVVNLTAPSVGEQVTCAYLKVSYMHALVATGTAPTLTQLRALASFMRSHTSGDAHVFLHDAEGGGVAVATAGMLLLMKGESWPVVQQELSSGEIASLTTSQMQAITELTSALQAQGKPLRGNPYSGVETGSW